LTDYRKYTTKTIHPLAVSTKISPLVATEIIVNGIETFWPPHLSVMTACSMHIKTTRVTSQNY